MIDAVILHPVIFTRRYLAHLERVHTKGLWSDEVLAFARLADMPAEAVERMKEVRIFKNFCDPCRTSFL